MARRTKSECRRRQLLIEIDEAEGILAQARLREISDEIWDLTKNLAGSPANRIKIEKLRLERHSILKEHIRRVL